MRFRPFRALSSVVLYLAACLTVFGQTTASPSYDIVIRGGRIIDGTGNPWYAGDIGIVGNRIVAIGKLSVVPREGKGAFQNTGLRGVGFNAGRVIEARGLVVAPGFIDMLGQSETALLIDNRSVSKLAQGITSEITGEGGSIAPQNTLTIAAAQPSLDPYHLKIDWNTLDEYWQRLAKKGTPINIGTYVGAAQVREAVLGDVNRAPTAQELEKMKALVAQAMQQGALGVSTALIYPPGHYAKTEELIELAKVAASYGGIYATHMRSEGQNEVAAVRETLRIGQEAGLPVEIFHLKVSGKGRAGKMIEIVRMIQEARDRGQDVTADMYPYLAGATALASSLPPWVADGGLNKLLERLHDPAVRQRIKTEMSSTGERTWENLYLDSGGAAGVMVASVVNPDLKQYTGKTIAEIAELWKGSGGKPEQQGSAQQSVADHKSAPQNKDPLDTLMDFVLADKGLSGALYFIASEEDLQTGLRQPWTSIGLDANELSLDGPLFEPHTHPRAFGSMPRFLGHYVRDLQLMPLEQAIRKITSLPAQRERLVGRGLIKEGFFADITIFNPDAIIDKATYSEPAQLAEGVSWVVVNGQVAFENGKATGVMAGKPLKGQGAK
jgi:dihydroorotase/N-acyl-D-amino-acid deacylase